MRFRWSALAVVLTLILMPRVGSAQSGTAGATPAQKTPVATLEQNYPNPFNPETRIPFSIGGYPTCTDPSHQYKVTMHILNVLTQLVAVPVIQGGAGNVAGGQALESVLLPCGQYVAYWNGNNRNTSKEAASGVYLYYLEVDGQKLVNKMIVMK
jgi:hypothetical protein